MPASRIRGISDWRCQRRGRQSYQMVEGRSYFEGAEKALQCAVDGSALESPDKNCLFRY